MGEAVSGLPWRVLALVLLTATVLSAGMIVVLRPLLQRYALARPNARSSHSIPTPQGGGIAVVAATLAGIWLGVTLSPDAWGYAPIAPLTLAVLMLAAIGAIDDVHGVDPGIRLIIQGIAIAIVIVALPQDFSIIPQLPRMLERALLLLGGLWFVNLVNFMDGLDWMTVAEVVPVTVGLVLLGSITNVPAASILVALALLGAMLGYAPFNRPVARLFLGDVGSLPIGLLLGVILLLLAGTGHLVAALLLPLYYVGDATVTLGRRLAQGERIWRAHRTHYYQRATEGGFSVLEVVVRVFVLNVALGVLAIVSAIEPDVRVDIAVLAFGGALVAWLLVSFARGKR